MLRRLLTQRRDQLRRVLEGLRKKEATPAAIHLRSLLGKTSRWTPLMAMAGVVHPLLQAMGYGLGGPETAFIFADRLGHFLHPVGLHPHFQKANLPKLGPS